MAFLLCVLMSFPFWMHVVLQLVCLGIFAFYTFLMNYTDKDFNKEATLKKIKPSKYAGKTVLEFLCIVGYPLIMLFLLLPLNHLDKWASVVLASGETVMFADLDVKFAMVGTLALMLVFVISCFTDTFAYIVGCTLKGPKLMPKVSPKKTISGAIAGLFGGIIGALLVILVMVQDQSPLQNYLTVQIGSSAAVQASFAALGLAGAIATQAGDLFASWLKRRANAKDFGKLLPGHGGVMDRLDGICFNTVLVWFAFMIIVFV